MNVLVAGAGGFIGGHLVKRLLNEGHRVCVADIKCLTDWWQSHSTSPQQDCADLKYRDVCRHTYEKCKEAHGSVDWVFNLACDMGGIGFIETNKRRCMESVLINTHLLLYALAFGVKRYLFTSSACVYAAGKQDRPDLPALKESDAYPAMAEDGYGWEKIFSERMCRHFREDDGLDTRIVRLHNVYGPHGSWNDGREKAPAAICRKVAEAKLEGSDTIEIWGDGTRTRSFMYVDDCVEGLLRIMESDFCDPINLGSAEMVTINQLVSLVEDLADVQLRRVHNMEKPQGVHGRNSDNTLIQKVLGWEPTTTLQEGLAKTYPWIEEQVRNANS